MCVHQLHNPSQPLNSKGSGAASSKCTGPAMLMVYQPAHVTLAAFGKEKTWGLAYRWGADGLQSLCKIGDKVLDGLNT